MNSNAALVTSPVKGGHALLRINGSTSNIQVWSNSSVNADIAVSNSTIDPIVAATVTGLFFSLTGNTAVLQRVVNLSLTVNLVTLSGTGSWTEQMGWQGDESYPTANLAFTYNSGSTGTIYCEVHKQFVTEPTV